MQTGNYAGTAQIYRYQNSLDHYHRMDRRRTRHEKRTKRLISVLVTAVIVLSAILLCLIVSLRKTEAVDRDLYKYYTTVEADQGDSLWTIAEENLTPGYRDCNELVDEIAAINHLTDTHIDVGQKLVVPYYSAVYKE